MNVLRYIISADATQFLRTLRGSAAGLRQFSGEVQQSVNSMRASLYDASRMLTTVRSGGGAAGLMNRPSEQIRVDWSGPQHKIKRTLEDAAESFNTRFATYAAGVIGGAFVASMAFDQGRRIGEAIADFWDRTIRAPLKEAEAIAAQSDAAATLGRYVGSGGRQHDVSKAGREYDVERALDTGDFDRAIALKQQEVDRTARQRIQMTSSAQTGSPLDRKAYEKATAEQAAAERDIEKLKQRRDEAARQSAERGLQSETRRRQEMDDADARRRAAERENAAARISAQADRAEFVLSGKPPDVQLAAKQRQLKDVEADYDTVENYRRASELRKSISEIQKRMAEEDAKAAKEAEDDDKKRLNLEANAKAGYDEAVRNNKFDAASPKEKRKMLADEIVDLRQDATLAMYNEDEAGAYDLMTAAEDKTGDLRKMIADDTGPKKAGATGSQIAGASLGDLFTAARGQSGVQDPVLANSVRQTDLLERLLDETQKGVIR